jgi:hypothetical protein
VFAFLGTSQPSLHALVTRVSVCASINQHRISADFEYHSNFFSPQALKTYNVTVARNTFIWAVFNLRFMRSHPEDMAGHVLPARASTRRRLIATMCAILPHPLHAGLMRHRRGDGDDRARIGRRPNGKRTFRSNTLICGHFDILGEIFTLSLQDLPLRFGLGMG